MDVAKIRSFHNLPKESFEVMGYGSSHIFAAMNTVLMRDEYGISAYNYGENWQKMDTTYLFILDSLKTQKPRLAVIETYMVDSFKKDRDLDGETYYTRALHVNKLDYLRNRFDDELFSYAAYCLPILQIHENWPQIDIGKLWNRSDGREYAKTLGQIRVDRSESIIMPSYDDLPQNEISRDGINRLNKVVDLCRDNDMEILFVTMPMEECYPYTNAMRDFALDNDCAYIDFYEYIDELGIDEDNDFYDPAHLNLTGSEKVSRFLSQYIIDNYEF